MQASKVVDAINKSTECNVLSIMIKQGWMKWSQGKNTTKVCKLAQGIISQYNAEDSKVAEII